MLHFVSTSSESNVGHARLQTLQTPQTAQTLPQAFPRPQVSQVHATLLHFVFTGFSSGVGGGGALALESGDASLCNGGC